MHNKIIWVYGTLKNWYWNHGVMKSAWWEFIGEDYVPFNDLSSSWIPFLNVDTTWESNKYCLVELYQVEDITPLDRLEWHPSFYTRTPVTTLSWKEIEVYSIERQWASDDESKFFVQDTIDWKKLYNWTKKYY